MLDTLKILVVDDNDDIRELICDELEACDVGKVFQASNAMDALKLINPNQINLIVSDLLMPGVNGIEFYHQTRLEGYQGDFIFITGADLASIHITPPEGVQFLEKPFNVDHLIEKIESVCKAS